MAPATAVTPINASNWMVVNGTALNHPLPQSKAALAPQMQTSTGFHSLDGSISSAHRKSATRETVAAINASIAPESDVAVFFI